MERVRRSCYVRIVCIINSYVHNTCVRNGATCMVAVLIGAIITSDIAPASSLCSRSVENGGTLLGNSRPRDSFSRREALGNDERTGGEMNKRISSQWDIPRGLIKAPYIRVILFLFLSSVRRSREGQLHLFDVASFPETSLFHRRQETLYKVVDLRFAIGRGEGGFESPKPVDDEQDRSLRSISVRSHSYNATSRVNIDTPTEKPTSKRYATMADAVLSESSKLWRLSHSLTLSLAHFLSHSLLRYKFVLCTRNI